MDSGQVRSNYGSSCVQFPGSSKQEQELKGWYSYMMVDTVGPLIVWTIRFNQSHFLFWAASLQKIASTLLLVTATPPTEAPTVPSSLWYTSNTIPQSITPSAICQKPGQPCHLAFSAPTSVSARADRSVRCGGVIPYVGFPDRR